MVSDIAIEEIERLEKDGLHPTPRDIIRLNALGLKAEAARNKNAAQAVDYLPRVAQIADGIFFRQPTIGHEIWLERVDQITSGDYQTVVAIRAYALSRPPDALVDPYDTEALKKAVDDFSAKCANFTRDQIYAAIDYVIHGANETLGEYPVREERPTAPDGSEGEDWKECIALGYLNEARAALWGVNQRELESMTRQQIWALTRRAAIYHGMSLKDDAEEKINEFNATVIEIEARLRKEREVKNG